jgi:phosphatidylglycerol lysyltransferase
LISTRSLINGLPIVAGLVALYMVQREITTYNLSVSSASQILLDFGWSSLLVALVCAALGYGVLALYDYVAMRQFNFPVSWPRALKVGFLSFSVSNNAGHAYLSGGSIRYGFYSGWGLNTSAIGQIILFGSLTYFLGALTLFCASSLTLSTSELRDPALVGGHLGWLVAGALISLMGYWALVLFHPHIRWRTVDFRLPSPVMTLVQSMLGSADLILASLVLYCLLYPATHMPFMWFFTIYILAQLLGLFSQVPGGIGVFEGTFLYLVGASYDHQLLIMALLTYRVIYYFLPLCIALPSLIWRQREQEQAVQFEAAAQSTAKVLLKNLGDSRKFLAKFARYSHQLLARILATLLVIAGAILLLSGSTPAIPSRLDRLIEMIGLPFVELSHLLGSIIGIFLLVLARAVSLRIKAAYPLTLAMLVGGIIFSLAKGWDYEEASFLGLLLFIFIPCRPYFYRKSNFEEKFLSYHWIVLIVAVTFFSIYIGFVAYEEVAYSHELWWQFASDANASRFLRSSLLVSLVCGVAILYYLLSRSRYTPNLPDSAELGEAEILIRQSKKPDHFIYLSGDKYFFWSHKRDSFIAYTTSHKYWIALNDPCGNPASFSQLVREFRAAADIYGAKPVFYRVGAQQLSLYVDLGLQLIKLGEEALVDIQQFTLKGNAQTAFRTSLNKLTREGYEFKILDSSDLPEHFDNLRLVSEQWLAQKKVREKGFSLGFFNEDYLATGALAVILKEGTIVAFTNLLSTDTHEEISIDLMRYGSAAPKGTMDFLFINILLWAQALDYRWFNLGMAPLAGMDDDQLAPLWQRLGSSIYKLENEFYDFKGLHNYKAKFHPQWQPIYLALPKTQQLPSVIFTITNAIARGISGNFTK